MIGLIVCHSGPQVKKCHSPIRHVLDSSAPNRNEQGEAVLQVLVQNGVSEQKLQNMIEVQNKDFVDGYFNEDEVASWSDENNDIASNNLCGEDLPNCDTNENEDF